MSSKVLETTYKIYKGQGNYLNKMEKILLGEWWKDIMGIIINIIILWEKIDFFLEQNLGTILKFYSLIRFLS